MTQAYLRQLESLCAGVLPWLTHLYDPASGGFFMTVSGHDDPRMDTALEMTSYGLKLLRNYTGLWTSMPAPLRHRFVDYFQRCQQPRTGYFIDRQGAANSRETARTLAASVRALEDLGASPRYPLPGAAEETVLPAYLDSPESYLRHVTSQDWRVDAWTAGDQTWQTLSYIRLLPPERQDAYLMPLFDWAERTQDEKTGLWGTPVPNFNTISGAFKLGLFYDACQRRLPRAETLLESVFACYENDRATVACYVRNALSLLRQLAGYDDGLHRRAVRLLQEYLPRILEDTQQLLCPDGGFSKNVRQSMMEYGGVVGSHGLWEGDIDSTVMILTGRGEIYRLLAHSAPPLTMDGFWDILSGRRERPALYPPETEWLPGRCETFERYPLGQRFTGSELRGNIPLTALRGEITADERRGQVLSLTADGHQREAAFLKVFLDDSVRTYAFAAAHALCVTLCVRFDGFARGQCCYLAYGCGPGFVLTFTAGPEMAVRPADAALTACGAALGHLAQGCWHTVRLRWRMGAGASVSMDGGAFSPAFATAWDVTRELHIGIRAHDAGTVRVDELYMTWEE